MNDLVAFLNARLDEDEQVARAATGEAWAVSPYDEGDDWLSITLVVSGDDVAESRGDHGVEYAEHIARHDPARVLADIAAKRQIIELHPGEEMDTRDGDGEEWSDTLCGRCLEPYPCDTLRLLAMPYAGHPDYRQEWKP